MGIEVQKRFFSTKAEALGDIAKRDLWPTTYAAAPSPAPAPHWHELDVHSYILAGTTTFVEGRTRTQHPVAAGDRVFIPAGTLHTEAESTETVVMIIALPGPGPFDDFLKYPAGD